MSAELLNADESSLSQLPFDLIENGLQATDPEVRAVALYALGARPEPQAVPLLVAALADPSPFLARTASDSLLRLGKRALGELLKALKNQDAQTRGLAARALALLADKSSIPALFNALEDESTVVQYWADAGLERMGVGQVYFKPS